ncbi:neuropeptide FF receptor 1 isoform X2 [Hemicordylus capensis]|uniref:neuropeptide FF receptor 1 isoform X2 n=1 Tax=Hemicordylus capensis TaxID=884348 RepID=UPI002303847A|nr:neuropeptide FF receptor 1 isoform X2 [Hemicordylus capensis]
MESEEGDTFCPANSSPPFLQNESHSHSCKESYTFSSYYQHSSPVAAMFIIAYLFIFFMCMIGNMLVCFIVVKNRQMRTVTNVFILNLAISDVLVGIFCMPTTLVDNLITGWPFNIFMCKMSGLVQGMSVSASVFTLVAIAVERFRCIVYPFRQKLTLRKALITIVIIWVLALIIMCPSAVTLTVTRNEYHFMLDAYNNSYPLYSCWEAWPDQEMRKIYTTILFSHIYLAPLTLIVIMYARIAFKLFKSSMPIGGSQPEENEGRRVSKRKVKVINMLIIVALFFTLSWLPLWTLMLLTDYGNLTEYQLNLITVYFFPFAHWLAFFNSSINPIIYGYFNENFRRGFQEAFKVQLCSMEREHKDTYSDRNNSGFLFGARNRIFVEVQGSDSVQPSESGQSSLLRTGLFPTSNGRVAHHGLMVEDFDSKGCSPNSVSSPAWDI